MHDQCQLVEVYLVLQKRVRVPRHLDKELILKILGDFWIFESMLIGHCLKHGNLFLVIRMKVIFVLIEESARFSVKLFEDHVQVEAQEDRKEHAHELRLELVQTLVNEVLQLLEALLVVACLLARVHVLVLGSLSRTLAFAEQGRVVLHKRLQIVDCECVHVSALAQVVGAFVLSTLMQVETTKVSLQNCAQMSVE